MNNRKVLSLLLVGALIVSMLVGCSNDKGKTSNANEQTKQTEQTEQTESEGTTSEEEKTNVSFAIVEQIDEETQKLIDDKVAEKGYRVLSQDSTSAVVLISSGEKPTGGYGIAVKTAEEKDGVVTITVEETSPDKDAVVTEVLTYPYTVVKLDTKASEFMVFNTEGEEFKNIDSEEVTSDITKEAEGTYNGAIDNNSVEIKLDGEKEPMAFRTEELNDFKAPEENAKVKISYYINADGQNVLKNIEVLNK